MTDMQSSGEERTFESGAVRDGGKKPMLQLISPHALMRLGEWLRFACQDRQPKPYAPRNWEKGLPYSDTVGALERHIQKFKLGLRDEDHVAAILFGGMVLAHQEEEIKAGRMDVALDDMPHYEDRPMLTPAACSDEANIRRREELLKRVDEGGELLNDKENDELQDALWAENNLVGCQGDPDPEPGDRRINPETGQEEVYAMWQGADRVGVLGGNIVERRLAIRPTATEVDVQDRCERDRKFTATEITKLIEYQHGQPTYYICGPMRGYPFFNFPAFDGARDLGQSLGFNIISPADLDRQAGLDPIKDPGCAERMQQADPDNFLKNIAKRDIIEIWNLNPKNGSGLALLPEWEDSTGANAEIALANWLGLSFVDATTFKPIANPLEV